MPAGSAVFEVQGAYTGILDADYVVQFATVDATGTLLGSRYRWSDSGGVTWNAEDLTPVPGTFVTLNNGVQIRFSNGLALPYVQLGDTRQFRAIRKWRVAALVDWSRNTELRSAAVTDGATWDLVANLGIARTPLACVLYDHNGLATTTIRLQSSTSATFTSLMHNQVIPWQADKIVIYPTASAAPILAHAVHGGHGTGRYPAGEWYLGGRQTVTPYRIGFGHHEEWLRSGLGEQNCQRGQAWQCPPAKA